jgi:hypothetical protein
MRLGFFMAIGILLPGNPTQPCTELAGFFASERDSSRGVGRNHLLGNPIKTARRHRKPALVGGYSDI